MNKISMTKFYQKMSPYYDRSIAFKTACELVFQGKDQPSGYTEPLLHLNRLIKKKLIFCKRVSIFESIYQSSII